MDGVELDHHIMDHNNGPVDQVNGLVDPNNGIYANGMFEGLHTDGMLSHENEELKDRVIALEKKLRQQEDEVVCLKSALSDCLRRLATLESTKSVQSHTNILPSKPNIRTPKRPSASHTKSTNGPSARYSPTPSRVVPRGPPSSPGAGGGGQKKWPSVPSMNGPEANNTGPQSGLPVPMYSPYTTDSIQYDSKPKHTGMRRSGSLSSLTGTKSSSSSQSSHSRVKEPSYNSEEKCLKFYLRGRAVSCYAPSNMEDVDVGKKVAPPTSELKLEWVYGYRGRDTRSNLYYLPTGEMIYFVASVVVLYNVEEQMQRHYVGHTDDVKCIAVHPDKITIATGQVAGHDKKEGKSGRLSKDSPYQPHVRIWNSVNLNTLKVIGIGDFDRAIACVCFSKTDGGNHLVAIDEANEHVISVWDWQKGDKGHKLTETKSSTEPVIVAEYHPCEENVIVSCGKNQISFWHFEGGTLSRKLGLFEKHDKPKYVTCLAFAENGDVISGDSNGNMFVWGKGTNRINQAITSAHEGGIFSICMQNDGTFLTGGKDRKIIMWDTNYKPKGVEYELEDQYGPVRMLSQGKGNMILVGTTKNCILQGSMDLKFNMIMQGHMDELWGLATHPNQNQFVSCGQDKNLYLWDTLTHSAVWNKELPDGAHSACFSPDGSVICIGTSAARWLAIDVNTRDVICTHTCGDEQLECMSFSPDGSMLAIGSRDNFIYLYAVSEEGKKFNKMGRCSGHSSFVTHIDWSSDCQYLQSNSGDYELLYWTAATCKQVTSPSSLRDVIWATQTCTLGFNVCGIWPEGADGTDVNACCRSNKAELIATADDFGKVNLYRYPCYQPKASSNIYPGHSSHVTNVSFLHDDSRLISAGGKDTALLQWQVIA